MAYRSGRYGRSIPTDGFVYDGLDLKRESEEGRGCVVLGSLLIFVLDAFRVVAST